MEVYNDRIYKKLEINEVRSRIIKGEPCREECDSPVVFKFLQLLKSPTNQINIETQLIFIDQQISVVKKAKKRSASLIFSQRNYAVYKCVIKSEKMNFILMKFYNTIIEQMYYPTRWLKILDIMLEKGKGPVLGKL